MRTESLDLQSIAPGPELLNAVRALLVLRGSSLTEWCRENRVTRQWAIAALDGKRNGPAAVQLRNRLIRAVRLGALKQPDFLTLDTFAKLAGISAQAARKACRGASWRGSRLIVRETKGRGGRSGTRYEVKVSSLPKDLQEALKATYAPVQLTLPLPAVAFKAPEAQWWSVYLRPLMETAKRSPERKAAIEAMAGELVMNWCNREFRPHADNHLQQAKGTGGAE